MSQSEIQNARLPIALGATLQVLGLQPNTMIDGQPIAGFAFEVIDPNFAIYPPKDWDYDPNVFVAPLDHVVKVQASSMDTAGRGQPANITKSSIAGPEQLKAGDYIVYNTSNGNMFSQRYQCVSKEDFEQRYYVINK